MLFRTNRSGVSSLWWQPADHSGPPQVVQQAGDAPVLEGVLSPDGHTLAYRVDARSTRQDIWSRRLDGDTTAKSIATSKFAEFAPRFSPDGRWVSYSSDESGVMQVYVQPFPGPGPRLQVSVRDGFEPLWSRDGRRLLYLSGGALMAATLVTSPALGISERTKLFDPPTTLQRGVHATYDVSPDGAKFLLLKSSAEDAPVIVTINWRSELRARTAGKATR